MNAIEQGRLAVVALVGGGVLSLIGIHRLRRRWLIENIPTSKIRSAAMGLVELKGKCRAFGGPAIPVSAAMAGRQDRLPRDGTATPVPGSPAGADMPLGGQPTFAPFLKSPVRGIPCVWCRVRVTKIVQHDNRRSESVVLDHEQGAPFQLEDDTGRMLVLPAGAEVNGVQLCDVSFGGGVEPPLELMTFCDINGVGWRGLFAGRFRVQEWALLLDADTYVLGELGKLGDAAARRRAGVLKRMKEMLSSPETRARLDTNKDGTLDPREWDAARREAEDAEIRRDLESPDDSPREVVRKPARGVFIIASGSEGDALKLCGYPWFFIVGGISALLFGLWVFPAGVAKAPLVLLPAGVLVAVAAFRLGRFWKR